MLPFRKRAALSLKGGGIRGDIELDGLIALEEYLGRPLNQVFQLLVGTSAGAIVAAATALGKRAQKNKEIFHELAKEVFIRRKMTYINPLEAPKYGTQRLKGVLTNIFGNARMGDLCPGGLEGLKKGAGVDLVITVTDMVTRRPLYIKSWKKEYQNTFIWYWVWCSCSAPTYFSPVDGQYVDGGVGLYNNPCFLAAFEARKILEWPAEETTLISLGAGRYVRPGIKHEADDWNKLDWLTWVFDWYSDTFDESQITLSNQFHPGMDFRHFDIELDEQIQLDDVESLKDGKLTQYGKMLADKILNDQYQQPAVPSMT